MKTCLFCPNPVNSKEHLWSKWIIEDLKLATPIRITIGRSPSFWQPDPEVKFEVVCKPCNNVWMGGLETANKFAIHAMIHGEPCGLTKKDQSRLSRWAVMKAMVLDTANEKRPNFYGDDERLEVKSGTVPIGTLVWLGKFSDQGYHAGGTDVWGDVGEVPMGFHGNITTFIMGHLAIQVLSGHVPPAFAQTAINLNCKDGAWNESLLDIWPVNGQLHWPPPISFVPERGRDDSISELVNRWKIGDNVA